ncbi:MAG: peptidoglycan editing factor PgeF [Methylococcaceae bacterium]|nr:peptidoglycan editing factor PgeF [Methylococcaceae bacterium]
MNANEHWLVPDWPAPDHIKAATTLRTGGVSASPYASFNSALHVGDQRDRVLQNRQLLKARLNLPDEPLWLSQIHSNVVIDAAKSARLQEADASYTMQTGIVCTVMTADCLPLLVCDKEGICVAAIHAGWRGLAAGIITNTIKALPIADLMVWLGPAIGPESFEVGKEVRDAFKKKSEINLTAFKQVSDEKWLADIYQLARHELMELGIDQVYGGNFCTVTDSARFYSYRRDNVTGRMATLIWKN